VQALIAYFAVQDAGARLGFLMPDKDSIDELFTENSSR
jgi:hypothetical protein